jgi:uncharacterized protein (TIGR02588 family)
MNDIDQETKTDSIQDSENKGRSLAEWVTFGVASAIVAIVVGLVVYVWLSKKTDPPILSITREESIRKVNGQFYVPFTLKNQGGETAESVHVIAKLKLSNDIEESGEQEVDFLSSGEQQEGAFIFSKDPQKGQLTLRVVSYKLP